MLGTLQYLGRAYSRLYFEAESIFLKIPKRRAFSVYQKLFFFFNRPTQIFLSFLAQRPGLQREAVCSLRGPGKVARQSGLCSFVSVLFRRWPLTQSFRSIKQGVCSCTCGPAAKTLYHVGVTVSGVFHLFHYRPQVWDSVLAEGVVSQ